MVHSDEDTCQLRGLIDGWEALSRQLAEQALTCSEALEVLESDPNSNLELRWILLNWFRGRVIAGKTLQFGLRSGNRDWFVKSVAPPMPAQPVGGSIASGGSLTAALEPELSDSEKQEIAQVLAEVRHSRNQTRLPNGRVREVIR